MVCWNAKWCSPSDVSSLKFRKENFCLDSLVHPFFLLPVKMKEQTGVSFLEHVCLLITQWYVYIGRFIHHMMNYFQRMLPNTLFYTALQKAFHPLLTVMLIAGMPDVITCVQFENIWTSVKTFGFVKTNWSHSQLCSKYMFVNCRRNSTLLGIICY